MGKILAILPTVVLYGKERSNIEVYSLLTKKTNHHLLIAMNNKAGVALRNAVDGLNTHYMRFPNRHRNKYRLLGYVIDYLVSNIQMALLLLRFRPNVIFTCTETNFYDNFLVLFFFRGKIVYRIGDEPAYKGLSFYHYNKFVWEKFVVSKVAIFVCISRYIQNAVKSTGRKSKNDVIIYNYPPYRKPYTSDEVLKYKSRGKAKVVFGYIGQIFKPKGVDMFIKCAIEILNRNNDCLFYVAGSLVYDVSYAEFIKRRIPKQYENRIILLDEIVDIELFFRHIDVLCVPSVKQEPLGNVIVEAKKYSTPCVIFPSGGMPELISHKIDGYVCKSQTIDALLEGMNYYIQNKNIISIHSCNSYNSICRLGIDRVTFENKWLHVFNQIIDDNQ